MENQWHWLEMDLMLNISACLSFFFYTEERVSLETAVDVLWFRMAIPALSHQGKCEKHWSEEESISLIKSVCVLFISSSVSLFIRPHIRLSKCFPLSLIEIILNFSFARCLSFSLRPRWSSRCNALGCDNLCWGSRFSSLLGQAATFLSSSCGKSHYDGFEIMMEKLISGRRGS